MKAITICQPYASLIAAGVKPVENRTRCTSYRGPLAIHAGKSRAWLTEDDDAAALTFGAYVAIAELWDCRPVEALAPALQRHEHVSGPFCLLLRDVVRLREPIPAIGHLPIAWTPRPADLAVLQAAWNAARR